MARDKYYPPTFDSKQFHCLHCGVYAAQSWFPVYVGMWQKSYDTEIKISRCGHCSKWAYWYRERIIIPDAAPVEPRHPDLPSECAAEYDEAMAVFSASPRAAAALLRLAIQKLMPHLGEPGTNINEDIASLVRKGLPALVQRALDYCRVVGNNAVHPGELDINDSPEIAQNLFRMINVIVEDRISRPKEIEALYHQLPEGAREAIEKRDGK